MPQPDGHNASGGADSQASPESVFWNGHGLKIPAQLGRYRIKRRLGGGGMGAVYLVENTELEREEALKVPHLESVAPTVVERFLREAKAAAKLDHPNLCQVYDVGAIDGIYFLTMRLLPGKPLSDYVGRALPPQKAVEIVVRLAKAMEHAHDKGVIHRDLKPSNVMMCPDTGPTVMDFGLARQTVAAEARLTQTGTTLGTPAYMPPEQVKGQLDKIGPASDVYSLGVILFELLTGKLPFVGSTGEVLGKVMYVEAPLASSLHPELGSAFDALCRKVLAKKPEDRYPSMKAFAAELLDVLRTLPKASEADPSSAATREKPGSPHTEVGGEGRRGLGLALILVGSLVATLVLFLVTLVWPGKGTRDDRTDTAKVSQGRDRAQGRQAGSRRNFQGGSPDHQQHWYETGAHPGREVQDGLAQRRG